MKQQPKEERGAEEEADILVAPISLLLVDAEMVLTVNFQECLASRPNRARSRPKQEIFRSATSQLPSKAK